MSDWTRWYPDGTVARDPTGALLDESRRLAVSDDLFLQALTKAG